MRPVTEREERFSRNEVLFREVNERIEKITSTSSASVATRVASNRCP
jgi:hypothetical protein